MTPTSRLGLLDLIKFKGDGETRFLNNLEEGDYYLVFILHRIVVSRGVLYESINDVPKLPKTNKKHLLILNTQFMNRSSSYVHGEFLRRFIYFAVECLSFPIKSQLFQSIRVIRRNVCSTVFVLCEIYFHFMYIKRIICVLIRKDEKINRRKTFQI